MPTSGQRFLNGPHGILIVDSWLGDPISRRLSPLSIVLDGYQVSPTRWGGNVIACPPGRHQVVTWADGAFGQLGTSRLEVDLADGQTLTVYYRVPAGSRGRAVLSVNRPRTGLRLAVGVAAGALVAAVAILAVVIRSR
ncbi:hypothetical protein SAMN04489812_4705 [Microlunatus soli]|uniref:Uncharacterized protein n=2 Tax=Microlunatus soli TaxID=630515 RepID=A0A1H1YPC9_9ACTN|nr:hypothetical protein SAMN04489812_4705 [Microlunatus soli]